MKVKPLKLLFLGIFISLIGAFLKIIKFEYSKVLLIIGLLLLISSGIIYILNRSKNNVA